MHVTDNTAAAAQIDLTAAYNDAAGRGTPAVVSGDLGGLTLPPGVYKASTSLGITGNLTLNGQGNSNSVFIFQVGSALTTAVGSQVILIGGARASNIFWQIGSSAILGTNSIFNGTIMAQASITLTTGAALNGRALARTGAVTLDTNTIVNSGPAVVNGPPPLVSLTCPAGAAQVGVAYSSLLGATGGTPPYAYSFTGSLPAGLTLNTSTGAISGTPTGAGTTSFSVSVVDGTPTTATQSCSIVATVSAAPPVTVSCPVNTGQLGVAYNSFLVAGGGTRIFTFSISSGALPAGLNLGASTGAITGTPTLASGTNTFVARVQDSASSAASQNCSISISSVPPQTPAPSSAILVLSAFACFGLYRSRDWLLSLIRAR